MLERVVIDARKLGDGGIGVYIENLVDGLLYQQLNKIFLITSFGQKIPSRWQAKLEQGKLEVVCDKAIKYSFSEYFIMPLRVRSIFQNSLLHFPHYTVPFFVASKL